MTTETLSWTIDQENVIKHLIESQNGTPSTAIKELIMNLFDKGSTKADITITSEGFKVIDDGEGFTDRDDIEKHFRCYGKKHEDGDAEFGRFRIGRGQIMALARTEWHSHEFRMLTDYKKNSQGFNLTVDPVNYVDGCTVSGTFYKPLDSFHLRECINDIQNQCKYLEIPVIINGIRANEDIHDINWDIETETVYIKFTDRTHREGVNIYSRGVYVKHLSSYTYGIDAEVVTKKTLDLNMARNEITATDQVWGEIDSLLRSEGVKRAKKSKRKLTDAQRASIISQLLIGDIDFSDVFKLDLITDCRGQTFSPYTLWNRKIPLTLCEDNHPLGERIASSRSATVLTHSELKKWSATDLNALLSKFRKFLMHEDTYKELCSNSIRHYINEIRQIRCIPYESIAMSLNSSYTQLKPSQLTLRQKAARAAIQYASDNMSKRITNLIDHTVGKRKIIIGQSDAASAWTDGASYICINENVLDMLDAGEYGFTQMALLLAHEYCHDDTDVGTHVHSNEFYEKFHNITVAPNKKLEVIGHIASSMKQRYISEISSKLLEPSKAAPHDAFEINEHVITLKSKGQVSNLLRSILDYFKEKNAINYTEKSNKINIVSSTKRTFDINVLHALIKLAEKDGVKIKPFNAEDYPNLVISRNSGGATHNDYEKARQDHYEKMLEKMKPWAHKYEHCLEAISEILLQRESYRLGNIETLAEIALKDRNSGVISYESPTSASPIVNYRTTTINYGSSIIGAMIGERWNHDFTLRELIESKKKRSEFTIKAITSVIKSLKNQDERREALQILSNESFKQNLLN